MRKYLSIIFFVTIYSICFSQTSISKEEFERVIDFVNCELTSKYIESLSGSSDKAKYDVIKPELSSNTIESPIIYDEIVPLINQNFSKTKENITDIINQRKTEYDNSLNNNYLIEIILKPIGNQAIDRILSPEYKRLQDFLFNRYAANFPEVNNSYTIEINELKQRIKEIEIKQFNEAKKAVSFKTVLIISIGVFAINLVLLLITLMLFDKKIAKVERKIKHSILEKINQQLIFENKENIKVTSIKQSSVDFIEKEINNLKNEFNILKKHFSLIESQKPNVSLTSSENKEKSPIFFMGSPSLDGLFLDKQKSTSPNIGVTLYRFSSRSNESASFSFSGDEISTIDALNTPHIYIEPVCNAENEIFINAKVIRTVKEGIAQKVGDNWIVKQKAIVRYE